MPWFGWLGLVIAVALGAGVAALATSFKLRSRLLHALRRRRRPGERRAAVAKRPRPPPTHSLEGALELREEGRTEEALAVLAALDQGRGLRRLLHAAAMLESGGDPSALGGVSAQLGTLTREAVRLRVAAAMAASDVAAARALLAPVSSTYDPALHAWVRASIARAAGDAAEGREALVDLLFAEPELARTVAARELALDGAEPSESSVERYGGFAFARDGIARFGAEAVRRLLERVGA